MLCRGKKNWILEFFSNSWFYFDAETMMCLARQKNHVFLKFPRATEMVEYLNQILQFSGFFSVLREVIL